MCLTHPPSVVSIDYSSDWGRCSNLSAISHELMKPLSHETFRLFGLMLRTRTQALSIWLRRPLHIFPSGGRSLAKLRRELTRSPAPKKGHRVSSSRYFPLNRPGFTLIELLVV